MRQSRRTVAAGLAAALASPVIPRRAGAQLLPAAQPPILFVHGNGDHAALWLTTLWRFESNGWPRDKLVAFNFTDPLAAPDVTVAAPNRSLPEDQLRELAAMVAQTRERTGADKVALIASSRGGYAVRNFVVDGNGERQVSHAILCGVPNRGVFNWEASPNSEFNGRGPFLTRLNRRDNDVVPETAFMTLRSDDNDKFAQPDGRLLGRPGVLTGIDSDGPALRGAKNVVLAKLDHREVAFHAFAFREQFAFISGLEARTIDVVPEDRVTLDGLVTGNPRGEPTNRPLAGATVEVYRVSPETGERQGDALHKATTSADGRWGSVTVTPKDFLEFVLAAPDHPITHIYRSPFPRSSAIVHLRPGRPLTEADRATGSVVLMTRPRGYFGIPRDVVLIDDKETTDVTKGVATDATTTLRLPASDIGRAVSAQFNEERIIVRAQPVAENRLVIAELTW